MPVCVAAMEAGKHAATEVPAAMTIEECWQLVETSEQTKRHCVMMENCCYDRPEMQCLNMVKQGLLGEILHAECGYLHDLRGVKFTNEGEGLWRLAHAMKRNANLYPTHGLGPVAQCMDINRGDRFDYLVSMSSTSRGLKLYAAKTFGPDDPRATRKYALGDVNVTLIQTALGEGDHALPRHEPAAAVQPHPHRAGDEGHLREVPRPGLHRGPQQERRVGAARQVPGVRPSRCGPHRPKRRGAPATAAWTTSRTTG